MCCELPHLSGFLVCPSTKSLGLEDVDSPGLARPVFVFHFCATTSVKTTTSPTTPATPASSTAASAIPAQSVAARQAATVTPGRYLFALRQFARQRILSPCSSLCEVAYGIFDEPRMAAVVVDIGGVIASLPC